MLKSDVGAHGWQDVVHVGSTMLNLPSDRPAGCNLPSLRSQHDIIEPAYSPLVETTHPLRFAVRQRQDVRPRRPYVQDRCLSS